MLTITAENLESPIKIEKFLKKNSSLPFSLIHKLLRKKLISVDGKKVSSSHLVENRQKITVRAEVTNTKKESPVNTNSAEYKKLHQTLKQSIISEDSSFLVFNKPSGINVQGGSKIKISIDDLLNEFSTNKIKPRLVHRLDRDTSGILIVAKNLEASNNISKLFQSHDVYKKYLAITCGAPLKKTGVVKIDIGDEEAKPSETKYKVRQKLKDNLHLLEFYPKTGRKHQIRITAKHLGCPILGDKKYNPESKEKKLRLHCEEMEFSISTKKYKFNAAIPDHWNETES
ncbi:MAG: RluA family pseudouridine synthase [Rickettsiales bacterium]